MPDQHFRLVIRGSAESVIDELGEAGCDDATFATRDGTSWAEFDRDAPTLLEAITSAIADVESVGGLRVASVEPDELVWASEIAERTGRSRQSVDLLIKAKRGPGNFPAPWSHSTRNPLWRWAEVERWFADYEGREPATDRSAVIEAINGALQARLAMEDAADPRQLQKAVRQLIAS
jgi:predicted DNA-binding transcriptional regulator AlpA